MNLKIWIAKKIHKRIMNYEKQEYRFKYMLDQIKYWRKEKEKLLQKQLKKLSEEEIVKFGIQTGYLPKQ